MSDYVIDGKILTDIADAIREKTGESGVIIPEDMPDAISDISGGEIIEPLSVTRNGTYMPPSGVDGYAPVVVNVPSGGNIQIQTRDFAKFNGNNIGEQANCVVTPYLFDENTGIEIEFMLTTQRAWEQICGTWDTAVARNNTWLRATASNGASGPLYIGDGTVTGQNANSVPNMFNTKHKIVTNLNGYSYVDDTIQYPYTPTSPGRNIPLVIGGNYLIAQHEFFTGRIYSYKVFNRSTGVQIANVYPATITITIDGVSNSYDALYDSIQKNIFFGGSIFYCDDE